MKITNTLIFIFLTINILQGQMLQTLLFRDVDIEGKVLLLEVRPEYKNAIVGLVKNEKVVGNTEWMNTDNSLYDIRTLNVPNQIDAIGTNVPEKAILKKALITPSIKQEIDIFLRKTVFSPRTVNLVADRNLFGFPYTSIVLFICLVSFLSLHFGLKQSLTKASLISALVGFLLIDMTSINDHLDSIEYIEKQYPYLSEIATTQQFVEEVKPLMEGGDLRFQDKLENELQYSFMKYQFADINNIRYKRKKPLPNYTFIITNKEPGANRKIIKKEQGFYLLQKEISKRN